MIQAPAWVWDAFARTQATTARMGLTDTAWAADEAGDAILDMVERGDVPGDPADLRRRLRNLMLNRTGKHRRRAAIKAVHYDPIHRDDRHPSAFGVVAARLELARIAAAARPTDLPLLARVGRGERLAEVAEALGATETAVKKRLVRARERIAA